MKKQIQKSITNLSNFHLDAEKENLYTNLYELYAKELYAFGLSLKMDEALIEDSIHDVFVELYASKNKILEINNVKYYLISSFRNRLFYLHKRTLKNVEVSNMEDEWISNENGHEIWIESETKAERSKYVASLLSNLSMQQKEAVYHKYINELNYIEIAQLMGINYQSVKNLIYRAIKKMRGLSSPFFTK